ncbi:MAG: hypothetical protein IKM01_01940 [Clostridia bacterium]|nr:hypothetical protein [Clostridia bacterium]
MSEKENQTPETKEVKKPTPAEIARKKREARALQEYKRKYFDYYDDIKYHGNEKW